MTRYADTGKINYIYPFKVWLTCITISPIMYIGWAMIISDSKPVLSAFLFIPFFIVFGLILSLPTLFLFYLAHRNFVEYNISNIMKKGLLSLVAIICMYATFYFCFKPASFKFSEKLFIIYSISIISSAFFHNLHKKKFHQSA
jgi:hypothetical protein